MSERQKETRFLKTLILNEDSEHGRQLQEKITRAEKDERCIRGAVFVVLLLVLLAISGLGYSAVLVPQFKHFSSHLATKVCCAVGLGSLICLCIFIGYWFWYRALSNRVYEECRRFLRAALEGKLKESNATVGTSHPHNQNSSVSQRETVQSKDDASFLNLSRAS